MSKLKLFTLILGMLNIIAGVILITFIIFMQNPLAFIMGILYIVFGGAILRNRIYKKFLLWGIIPLTVLFSVNIIMLGIDKDVPEYFQTPLYIGLLIILPLWLLIFGNVYSWRKLK